MGNQRRFGNERSFRGSSRIFSLLGHHVPHVGGGSVPTKKVEVKKPWRPADWKPNWDPEALCPECLLPLGVEFLPVIPTILDAKGECVDTGRHRKYHHFACGTKFLEDKRRLALK
jgi:hypothetical protein